MTYLKNQWLFMLFVWFVLLIVSGPEPAILVVLLISAIVIGPIEFLHLVLMARGRRRRGRTSR